MLWWPWAANLGNPVVPDVLKQHSSACAPASRGDTSDAGAWLNERKPPTSSTLTTLSSVGVSGCNCRAIVA